MIKIIFTEDEKSVDASGDLVEILTDLAVSTIAIFDKIEEQSKTIKAIDLIEMYMEGFNKKFDIGNSTNDDNTKA